MSDPIPDVFVLCRTIQVLAGRCPSCGNPCDRLGCRILERYRCPRAIRHRTGVAEIIKIDCRGTSTLREIACPCCANHPGQRCPHESTP